MIAQAQQAKPETHDQFVLRASRFFPPEQAASWSRLQRAIFNGLLSELIYRHGYDAISDDMLLHARAEMEKLVRLCCNRAPAPEHSLQ